MIVILMVTVLTESNEGSGKEKKKNVSKDFLMVKFIKRSLRSREKKLMYFVILIIY